MASRDHPKRVALQVAARTVEAAQNKFWTTLKLAVAQGEATQSHASLDCLLTLATAAQAIGAAEDRMEGHGKPIYLVDSWFLTECQARLTKTEDEGMLFVTGPQVGSLRVFSRTLTLRYAEQSPVFVNADDASTRAVLGQLDRFGLRLLGWFHSHPGAGKEATLPSCIDLSHQGDLEKGGYPVVGVIFTKDGWVRFFTNQADFEVIVFGDNASQIDQRTYRLTNQSAK